MLVSVRLEILLFLTQDRCTVCLERTTGSKIALDTPDRNLGDLGHVESYFGLFGERVLVLEQDRCTACVERTIGLKIILDTPDGTPR
jgi:hypothetical protein